MEFSPISKFAKKIPRKGTGLYYDPLYGYVPLPDYLRKAMDLDVFQRLQGIKQLSTVYLTFRGAVHTRFDHCVGTAYLASILFNKLRELVVESDCNSCQDEPIVIEYYSRIESKININWPSTESQTKSLHRIYKYKIPKIIQLELDWVNHQSTWQEAPWVVRNSVYLI